MLSKKRGKFLIRIMSLHIIMLGLELAFKMYITNALHRFVFEMVQWDSNVFMDVTLHLLAN